MKDEVLWRLDFSVSDSYFEECLILRLILAGCQDLLIMQFCYHANNFLMVFSISGLGMFKYRPQFLWSCMPNCHLLCYSQNYRLSPYERELVSKYEPKLNIIMTQ